MRARSPRILLPAVLGLVAALLAACGSSSSKPAPTAAPSSGPVAHIGSTQAQVQKAWKHNPAEPKCSGRVSISTCSYVGDHRQMLVIYNEGTVRSIQVGHYSDPASPAQWAFLTSLLPSGARKTGCKQLKRTVNSNGAAHACLYSWNGQRILVAQYLHPNGPDIMGEVDLGVGYSVITPRK